MFKNVASQKIQLFAFDTTTGAAKTGDAANITAYVSKDYGAVTVLGDTSATEEDSTNAKGCYIFDLTQAETNADTLRFSAKSSTANISIVTQTVYTFPASFTSFVTPTNLTAAQIATGVWQDTTAGDFTTALSVGKSVMNGVSLGTGLTVAAVAGAVGSVTAAVTLSAGDSPVLQSGTATAGAGSTITIQTALGADSLPNGCAIKITSGTGAKQARIIIGYVDSTKVATVDHAWTTNPDATSVYSIIYADAPRIDSSLQVTAASVQGNVTGSVASVTGAVGSVTGAVASVTGNVGGNVVGSVASVTAGVTLAASAVQAVWDALTSVLTTASSIGKLLVDNINATVSSRLASASYTAPTNLTAAQIATGVWQDTTAGDFTVANSVGKSVINGVALGTGLTINAYTGNTAQTGDAFARLGAPAGASVSVDVAAVKTDTAAVKVQTDKLTFTVANKVDANELAINGDATSAANLAKTTRAIGRGTVTAGASTTSIPTSAFTPNGAAADQFKGRIITFDTTTATAALQGQSTDITASSNAAAPTFTVTALTTAPANGDTFSVT